MLRTHRSRTALFLAAAALGTATIVGQVGAEPSGEATLPPGTALAATATPPSATASTTAAPIAAAPITAGPTTVTTAPLVAVAPTTSTLPSVTTTTAPPTTTTTAAPAPTTTTVPPRTADVAPADRMAHVVALLDSTGFDWRAAGVSIQLAFHPDDCCHWGNYETATRRLWIGPTAFASASRLRYVVLHEAAHAWQITGGQWARLMTDMQPWGYSGADALEHGADCVASVWGATTSHYWSCPAAARALMQRRLAGDWA